MLLGKPFTQGRDTMGVEPINQAENSCNEENTTDDELEHPKGRFFE